MGGSESMLMDSNITMMVDDLLSTQSCSNAYTVQRTTQLLSKPKLIKWKYYNSYGLMQVVLLHDVTLGRREIMCNNQLITLQPTKLLDNGSVHIFQCYNQQCCIKIISNTATGTGTYDYMLYIDNISIIEYQQSFWSSAVYWPVDSHTHCIIYPSNNKLVYNDFTILINNQPQTYTIGFTDIDNCISHQFTHNGNPYEFRHYKPIIQSDINSLKNKPNTAKYELRMNNKSINASAPPQQLSTIPVAAPKLIHRKNSCALEQMSEFNTLDKNTIRKLVNTVV